MKVFKNIFITTSSFIFVFNLLCVGYDFSHLIFFNSFYSLLRSIRVVQVYLVYSAGSVHGSWMITKIQRVKLVR